MGWVFGLETEQKYRHGERRIFYLKVDSFLFIIAEFQYDNLIKITRWSFDDLRSFSFSAVIRNSDKESVTVCLSTYYFYIFVDNNQIQGRSDLRCQLFSSSLALNASSFLSSSKNIWSWNIEINIKKRNLWVVWVFFCIFWVLNILGCGP